MSFKAGSNGGIVGYGGILWWGNINKLVEWKVLMDTVGTNSANFKE